MGFRTYAEVLKVPAVRSALGLGFLIRVPLWAGFIAMTLHVVSGMGRSYSDAGLITFAGTVAVAISGPWRGRKLDQVGVRRTIGPQLLVLAAVWAVAPWVSYWPLLVMYVVAGLATVGSFSIVRQVVITAVPDDQRQTALSLDAVATEISFMIGPVLGVLLATTIPTGWALVITQYASLVAGIVLWFQDPPVAHEDHGSTERAPSRQWLSPAVVAVLAASAAATLVLTGTDLGIVAALRSMDQQGAIGWVLAVWGLGSAIGGLLYGALHRPIPVFWLLLALAVTTVPVVVASEPILLSVLLFVAGALCAPTITATIDHLSRLVPANVRGEAMGWHGAAMTFGSAIGSPIAGVAIDHRGWQAGFLVTAGAGVLVAVLGLVVIARRARQVVPTTAA
jgi:predicted MFS family arabinose efflux permease